MCTKGEGEEYPRRQVRRLVALVGSVAQARQRILIGKEGEDSGDGTQK